MSVDYIAIKLSKYATESFTGATMDKVCEWIENSSGREPKTFYIYKTENRTLRLIRKATFDPKLVWTEIELGHV